MSHIFISYSRKDKEYAYDLAADMESKGFEIWIDRRIEVGDRWISEIKKSLDTCEAFLVIMTQHSEESNWVQKELTRASRKGKPIIPLLVEGDVWLQVEDQQYLDLREEKNKLPSNVFYLEVRKKAPSAWTARFTHEQHEQRRIDRIENNIPIIEDEIEITPPDSTIYTEIVKWSDLLKEEPNNFYSMTMLALVYESEGSAESHTDAIHLIKKAYKLEPRLKIKHWMSEHYGLTEEHHNLLEKILVDSNF